MAKAAHRAPLVLRCADGLSSKSVATELGLHEHAVGKWRRRFLRDRCDGLLDEALPGDQRRSGCCGDGADGADDASLCDAWSIRSMAAETGFSHSTIRRM